MQGIDNHAKIFERRIIRLLMAATVLALLGGCSAIKLAYNNLPDLGYWWVDSYADLNEVQSLQLRADMASLHAWHRRNELPRIADLLQQVQKSAIADTTPEQVCSLYGDIRSRFDAVVDHLAEIASGMKMGPGIDPATQIGPLVSKVQQTRVLDYVQSGFAEGARAAAGGAAGEGPGCFVRPTVLVDVHEDMRVVREEIFGPVVVAQAFDDLDDIARRANDTPYGLAASIWSNDLSRVHRLIPKIKAGTVWVNCHNIIENVMPFGGFKQSGIGREAGRAALELYTESKSVIMML